MLPETTIGNAVARVACSQGGPIGIFIDPGKCLGLRMIVCLRILDAQTLCCPFFYKGTHLDNSVQKHRKASGHEEILRSTGTGLRCGADELFEGAGTCCGQGRRSKAHH